MICQESERSECDWTKLRSTGIRFDRREIPRKSVWCGLGRGRGRGRGRRCVKEERMAAASSTWTNKSHVRKTKAGVRIVDDEHARRCHEGGTNEERKKEGRGQGNFY